jgi:catalase-peroxidase
MEPAIDAFRNYVRKGDEEQAATALVDRAALLQLTAPQMTALVGGMRAIGCNYKGTRHGVFTSRPGALTNDFFVNLLDMCTKWQKSESDAHVFEGLDRADESLKWTATIADLVFGSNSQLRALAEVYAADDGDKDFVNDFVRAWTQVMEADRFDLHR